MQYTIYNRLTHTNESDETHEQFQFPAEHTMAHSVHVCTTHNEGKHTKETKSHRIERKCFYNLFKSTQFVRQFSSSDQFRLCFTVETEQEVDAQHDLLMRLYTHTTLEPPTTAGIL